MTQEDIVEKSFTGNARLMQRAASTTQQQITAKEFGGLVEDADAPCHDQTTLHTKLQTRLWQGRW